MSFRTFRNRPLLLRGVYVKVVKGSEKRDTVGSK